jgi:hypothetical protein
MAVDKWPMRPAIPGKRERLDAEGLLATIRKVTVGSVLMLEATIA